MKIGIIQLSDLHLTKETDFAFKKIDQLTSSISGSLIECNKLYIVVTGDLSNSGNNYQVVSKFLEKLKSDIKSKFAKKFLNSIEFVLIPGNHDCFLPKNEDEIRQILIEKIRNSDEVSESLIEKMLESQKDFWDFYLTFLNQNEENKISYSKKFPLRSDLNLVFHCYNTSWMSQRIELAGGSIFPTNKFLFNQKSKNKNLTISIHHHPVSWLSPNTPLNNKKKFIKHLRDNSNIILCGHEHEIYSEISKEFGKENEVYYFECPALQTRIEGVSGYNTLLLDTVDDMVIFSNHVFENDLYVIKNQKSFKISGKSDNPFEQSTQFLKTIKSIPIPLKHQSKDELDLFDLFVYPDLEPILDDYEKISQYQNSENVILDKKNEKLLIEGASQSGKTSLLYKYFIDLFNNDYIPIYLSGKSIKTVDIESTLKKCLKEQYNKSDNLWDKFTQIESSKRVLLIDSIDNSPLNEETKKIFVKKIERYFEKIVITVSEESEIHTISENEKVYEKFKHYKIIPLGRLKRNEIIEKWISLGKENNYNNEIDFSHMVQSYFDSINDLLGEQLIPPYPIFILTLLQSLENSITPFNIAPTSYAYCYQSLIHIGLTRHGVNQKDMAAVFNFLSELSYDLYKRNSKKKSDVDFEQFYSNYKNQFIINFSIEEILSILTNSTILIKEDNFYFFSYKYISFYLTAKYLSKDISEEKTKKEIIKLCSNLENEDNANILIFLTHHTHQQVLLDEILFASMLPFESIDPITLNVDDPFFHFLSEFIKEIKTDVVPSITNHKELREKKLKEQDDNERILNQNRNQHEKEEIPEEAKEFIRVLKIIRILGQIAKNQQGNFEKDKLLDLLQAAYLVCFRSINFVSDIIQKEKSSIIELVLKEKDHKREALKSKVDQILFNLGFRVCLQSFSNLCMSIGASNMDQVYDDVANQINTPAAKLITFSIKSYYGKLNVTELEDLIYEFKGNPVTTEILRARVKSYLYQHKVDYKKEQKISSICQFQIDSSKKFVSSNDSKK